MSADYTLHGDVAVITLNNPPVNGLSLATRTAIVAGLNKALADDAIKALVITGAGKAFCGGADIREFNTPKTLTEPTTRGVIAELEASTKPVVAAIHSVAMGGGLELAMGCHFRVAAPNAQIALPEVKLGLLPGAGGTQRLPRLVGVETALNMIVSGTPAKSQDLADTALFDQMIEGTRLEDLLAENQRANTLVVYAYKEELAELKRRFPHAQTLDDDRAIERWNALSRTLMEARRRWR